MSINHTNEKSNENKRRIAVELDKLIAAITPIDDAVLKLLKTPGQTKQ